MVSLVVNNLVATRDVEPLFEPLSFSSGSGKICLVTGENGAGKSSLISILMGELPISGGFYEWRLSGNPMHALGAHIWWQPQERFLFDRLSIHENLLLARGAQQKRQQILWHPFPEVSQILHRKAGELSGGERKMVAFLCVCNSRRDVWLMDEPSAGLSDLSAAKMCDAMQLAARQDGRMILVVEHQRETLAKIADSNIVVCKSIQEMTVKEERH